MAQYKGSTQETSWLMSANDLSKRRAAARSRHVAGENLSPEEDAMLRRHHERRILRFITRIGFPEKVAATAITYFKRFFLDRSVLEYNPSVIALSSLYAALKVEEVHLPIEDLISRFNEIINGVKLKAPDDSSLGTPTANGTAVLVDMHCVLTTELSFLSLLRFHLICYHPYRSLLAVADKIKASDKLTSLAADAKEASAPSQGRPERPNSSRLDELLFRAKRIIARRTLFSDAQFLYPPAVIGIASVFVAAEELALPEESEFRDVIQSDFKQPVHDEVAACIHLIRGLEEGGADAETVARVERTRARLGEKKNDPTSAEYRKEELAKNEEVDLKRRKKLKDLGEERKRETARLMGFE